MRRGIKCRLVVATVLLVYLAIAGLTVGTAWAGAPADLTIYRGLEESVPFLRPVQRWSDPAYPFGFGTASGETGARLEPGRPIPVPMPLLPHQLAKPTWKERFSGLLGAAKAWVTGIDWKGAGLMVLDSGLEFFTGGDLETWGRIFRGEASTLELLWVLGTTALTIGSAIFPGLTMGRLLKGVARPLLAKAGSLARLAAKGIGAAGRGALRGLTKAGTMLARGAGGLSRGVGRALGSLARGSGRVSRALLKTLPGRLAGRLGQTAPGRWMGRAAGRGGALLRGGVEHAAVVLKRAASLLQRKQRQAVFAITERWNRVGAIRQVLNTFRRQTDRTVVASWFRSSVKAVMDFVRLGPRGWAPYLEPNLTNPLAQAVGRRLWVALGRLPGSGGIQRLAQRFSKTGVGRLMSASNVGLADVGQAMKTRDPISLFASGVDNLLTNRTLLGRGARQSAERAAAKQVHRIGTKTTWQATRRKVRQEASDRFLRRREHLHAWLRDVRDRAALKQIVERYREYRGKLSSFLWGDR